MAKEKITTVVSHKPETNLNFDWCLRNTLENRSDSKERIWINLEKIRSFTEFTPFIGDVEDCEDTERIVLFDDISFALFNLPASDLQFQLVLSYLFLMGVPVCKNMFKPKIWVCFCKYYLVTSPSYLCLCHSQLSCHYVHIKSNLFTASNLTNTIVVSSAQEILSQSLTRFSSSKHIQILSKIWFHLESILFRREFENISKELDKKHWKEMRKFIKSLLKLTPNRSFIELWEMYATYEWSLGNIDDAKKIFLTAGQLIRQQENESDLCLCISSLVR